MPVDVFILFTLLGMIRETKLDVCVEALKTIL